jgi:hypothetical protein
MQIYICHFTSCCTTYFYKRARTDRYLKSHIPSTPSSFSPLKLFLLL